jgi:hypothetical protein
LNFLSSGSPLALSPSFRAMASDHLSLTEAQFAASLLSAQ